MERSEVLKALNVLADDIYQTATDKGWHVNTVPFPAQIALIHSELSEALQADRKREGDAAVTEELADVVIRVLDTARDQKLDIAGAIVKKAEANKARPYRHGGRKY